MVAIRKNCVDYVNLETARQPNCWRAIIVLVDSRAAEKYQSRGKKESLHVLYSYVPYGKLLVVCRLCESTYHALPTRKIW